MILRVPGAAGLCLAATWLWVVTAGVFISVSAHAASAQAPDFRGVEWGMSEETVVRLEDGQPLPLTWEGLHYLVMPGTVPARVQTQFEDNKLYAASYSFLRKRAASREFIREFEAVNKSLKGLYGEPVRDETIWIDRLYEHKPQEWGFAVRIGHLKVFARWETGRSYISHIMYGRSYRISHSILSESRAWKDAAGKQIKARSGKE